MKQPLQQLLELLKLKRVDENSFLGDSQDLGFPAVYGGQVLGQALSAATQTLKQTRYVHSLHAYFLRPGNFKIPIHYEVNCIRDGKSFTTRQIIAYQNQEAIFNMSASFTIEENGLNHQTEMPQSVPPPEQLKSNEVLLRSLREKIPPEFRERLIGEQPLDIRVVNPQNPCSPAVDRPIKKLWVKASDFIEGDLNLHACLLAYASDFGLLSTSLKPHGKSLIDPQMHIASIDHSLWIHRSFSINDWLLFSIESPSAAHARGFARCQIFTRSGELVASVAQEGLIRLRQ